MINRSLGEVYHKDEVPLGPTLLEARALSGEGFADVSLTVRRGEIVGLYGLIGAGRSEFVHALFGREPHQAGDIRWKGEKVDIRREADAISRGIALVPESRRDQGLCLNLGVSLNLNLPIYERLSRGPVISPVDEARAASVQIDKLRIITASRGAPASSLSGGNQQKIVIGKWLNHGAELFIFDEPTAGVDVRTKVDIYRVFSDLLRAGAGIILISSYLPEVYNLSDRLHVFRKGRLVASHAVNEATQEEVLAEAIGV
jgi:ribose transport system ATP-binding protein